MKSLRELIEAYRADADLKIPTASGVYQITCIPTGKIYIGSAVNLRSRWGQHKRKLIASSHYDSHLQAAWNTFGAEAFSFSILELIAKPLLVEREQEWIDRTNCTNREIGFNISKDASYPSGMNAQVWEGFINPDGQEVTITNLNEFSRDNGLIIFR